MSNLFRKKSLERISSPEQLNSYIRVSTPSVWLLLTAIALLLTGVCVWGILGHMDTLLPAVAVCHDGEAIAYVRKAEAEKVSPEARVYLDGVQGRVLSVGAEPIRADESFTEYMLHVGNLQQGEWVVELKLDLSCEEGVYPVQIVIDSVSPLSFVLN